MSSTADAWSAAEAVSRSSGWSLPASALARTLAAPVLVRHSARRASCRCSIGRWGSLRIGVSNRFVLGICGAPQHADRVGHFLRIAAGKRGGKAGLFMLCQQRFHRLHAQIVLRILLCEREQVSGVPRKIEPLNQVDKSLRPAGPVDHPLERGSVRRIVEHRLPIETLNGLRDDKYASFVVVPAGNSNRGVLVMGCRLCRVLDLSGLCTEGQVGQDVAPSPGL